MEAAVGATGGGRLEVVVELVRGVEEVTTEELVRGVELVARAVVDRDVEVEARAVLVVRGVEEEDCEETGARGEVLERGGM